jgi:hypothetical protein
VDCLHRGPDLYDPMTPFRIVSKVGQKHFNVHVSPDDLKKSRQTLLASAAPFVSRSFSEIVASSLSSVGPQSSATSQVARDPQIQ